jgi:hypothetical protein
MIKYVQVCLGTLGFEVFEPKTPFLQVLDCHNSPQRAGSSQGELENRTGGPAHPQLATASGYSPPTRHGELTAPKRAVGSFRAVFGSFAWGFPLWYFYKSKPLKPRSYMMIF